MPTSLESFVHNLADSRLISRERLMSLLDELPVYERPTDGEGLARWLVAQGHLTPYQATQVYQGHWQRLVLDNYVILDRLGAGGMGQVYKAEHQRMRRLVALKMLPENVSKDPRTVARFQREAQAAARLMHPNIVTAFDADEADGAFFLVMEYVPGKDLASLVRRHGPLPVHQAISCVLDAARGLEYAHRNGVIHRDIKPANLLLSAENDSHVAGRRWENLGTVKILDMGVAHIDAATDGGATQTELTGTGMVIGTVDFMSPEQALETRQADHRSDIYSLGMTLYFLLTGKPAYAGDSAIQRVVRHREEPIPTLRTAGAPVPEALDALFAKMVAKQPQDRYSSMSEVVTALQDVQSSLGEPIPDDMTAVAVAGDMDTAMQGFLQAIRDGETPAEPTDAATPLSTDAGMPDSETAVGRPGTKPSGSGPADPDEPPRGRLLRQWLWPAIVVGVCSLVLLLPSGNREIDRPAGPRTDGPDAAGEQGTPENRNRFALRFDSPHASVNVPDLGLDLSQPFAFEAWCRPQPESSASNVGRFVGQLGPVQVKIWKDRWQAPIVDVTTRGAAGVFLESADASHAGDRVHVAFQWTGEKPLLFVNGQPAMDQLGQFNLDGSAQEFLAGLFVPEAPSPLRIGNFEYGGEASDEASGQFGGTIEAVRVSHGLRYNVPFDPGDLLADEQTVALYDFHEGTGDVLHDVSGQGHNGTIVDARWTSRGDE